MEIAGGKLSAFSGLCHSTFGSRIHAQYICTQVSWSNVVDNADVSADRVLVTMRWIFFVPHEINWTDVTRLILGYIFVGSWDYHSGM